MSSAKEILFDNFVKGCEYLLDKDKERLILQGHKASGRLERSLRLKTYFKDGALITDFFMKSYGVDLDRGLRPNQIFTRPQDYEQWAKIVQPGLSKAERDGFVCNVWKKHKTGS